MPEDDEIMTKDSSTNKVLSLLCSDDTDYDLRIDTISDTKNLKNGYEIIRLQERLKTEISIGSRLYSTTS